MTKTPPLPLKLAILYNALKKNLDFTELKLELITVDRSDDIIQSAFHSEYLTNKQVYEKLTLAIDELSGLEFEGGYTENTGYDERTEGGPSNCEYFPSDAERENDEKIEIFKSWQELFEEVLEQQEEAIDDILLKPLGKL